MTTRDIVFSAVGAITALSALLSVTTKHVVHAALWLLVSLGSLAGAYLVLGQELVGLVQLLVYVGAIVVLVLFALMLTRAPIGPHAEIDTPTTTTPQVAQAVFGTWVWPFELLSVLLLVALIGAFAVSRLVLGERGPQSVVAARRVVDGGRPAGDAGTPAAAPAPTAGERA